MALERAVTLLVVCVVLPIPGLSLSIREILLRNIHSVKRAPAALTDTCFPGGGPLQQLNFASGAWLNIFVDLKFECDGDITQFTYYARQPGTFFVGIWRPHGDSYRLVAKHRISASKVGKGEATLSSSIPVLSGDVLGVHYDNRADDASGGVVPYEDSRHTSSPGVSRDQLSRFLSNGLRDNALPVGKVVNGPPLNLLRLPALTATLRSQPTVVAARTCGVPAITPDLDDRIVGGRPALPHSWPWMASLRDEEGDHFCGGSLIAPGWVVTAAHCLPGWRYAEKHQREVALGLHHQTRNPEKKVYAKEVFSNADYNSRTNDNDIMLLKLSQEIQMTDTISPICLVKGPNVVQPGKDCYSAGWGHTSFMGRAADELQQVRIPVLRNDRCNSADWYSGKVKSNMICAGYEEGGKDSCQGDSGGPLMCQVNDRWVLNGVVSWGKGCASEKKPGIYTRVGSQLAWIKKIMRENS